MWPIIVMYLILIPCVVLFIKTKHKKESPLSTMIKALCTGIVLFTAVLGLAKAEGAGFQYAALITAGIALGLVGDVAICSVFELGMLFFGLGHLCYISAILRVSAHLLWSIPIFIAVYTLVIFIYRKSHMSPKKQLIIPMIVYSIIIAAMLSLSLTMPSTVAPAGYVIAVGALLFVASDSMLAWNVSFGLNKKLDTVSLSCYYMAQSLFAVSVFLIPIHMSI